MIDDKTFHEAAFRMVHLSEDITGIKQAIGDMANAIAKLAVFEERQSNDRAALVRVTLLIEAQATRLEKIELLQPVLKLTSTWVQTIVGLAIGAVATAIFSMVVYGKNPATASAPAQARTEASTPAAQ